MKRKLLSILLTLTMTFSIIPMFGGTAFAKPGTDLDIFPGDSMIITISDAKYSDAEGEGNIKDINFIMETGDGEDAVFTNVDDSFSYSWENTLEGALVTRTKLGQCKYESRMYNEKSLNII